MLHPHPPLLPTPSPVLQVAPVFEGLSGGAGSLIKYNPLSNITSAECWNFLRVMVRARASCAAPGRQASWAQVHLCRGRAGRWTLA